MKTLKIILLLLVGVAVAVGLWFWQQYSSLHPSTEDAYVEAHTVTISPQVSGQVAGVPAYSYQTVQQGDVLLVLDDSNYRIALEQAKARLTLAQSGETHATEAKAQLLVAQLAVERAELDLAHTTVIAPVSGVLGEVRIRPGDYINTGQNLFPMVDYSSVWVAANFKETDLEHIHPGQPVDIVLDMYPKLHYQGQVESVSPASGSAFSLIPAQNATGNWVKVTQRFPVRIFIPDHEGLPLPKVGASAAVTIDASAATDITAATAGVKSGPEKMAGENP